MSRNHRNELSRRFSHFADRMALAGGHPLAFILALASVAVWGLTGPFFAYSENWRLVINTGTTIVTFLMVFLIQNSQNRDTGAIQAKLDALIRTSSAQNAFIGIEHRSEEEVEEFRRKCAQSAEQASKARMARKNRKAARSEG